jgi:hypothetical protein
MALIVEDGTGLTDAEAFAAVADADTYWAARGNADWAALTEAEKEQHLRLAADYMEVRWRLRWKGRRLTAEQALAWPRSGVCDEDGYEVAEDAVPARVAVANIEYADRSRLASLLPDPVVDDTGARVQRKFEKVGPIEEETEYAEGASVRVLRPYPKADRTLVGLLKPTGGVIRA